MGIRRVYRDSEGNEQSGRRSLRRRRGTTPLNLARVLRLTLLAPDIVEAILDGRHDPERITLERLMRPIPVAWDEQRF